MYLLYIDTSSQHSLVFIFNEKKILASRTNEIQSNHGQVINIHIDELLHEADISMSDLNGICVLNGPGSYTGLRISLATAKGICYANDIPLFLINKLDLLFSAIDSRLTSKNIAIIIKAREDEFFTAIYSSNGAPLLMPSLLTKSDLLDKLNLNQAQLYFEDDIYTSEFEAFTSIKLSLPKIHTMAFNVYKESKPADLFQSEPFYLKNVHINKINKL